MKTVTEITMKSVFDSTTTVQLEMSLVNLGGQASYFGMTYTRWENGVDVACGPADMQFLLLHFPGHTRLLDALKWHLFSFDGPMHYIANTMYWLGYSGWCDGKPNSPPNTDHAIRTSLLGELEGDENTAAAAAIIALNEGWIDQMPNKADVIASLEQRLPRLLAKFEGDMVKLFGREEVEKHKALTR